MSAQNIRSQRVDTRLRTGGSATIAVAILELLVGIEFLLGGLSKAFESVVALLGGLAGLGVAALQLGIFGGGGLPGIDPANAFGSPIMVNLLLAFLGLVIAVFEFGRFGTLRRAATVKVSRNLS